MMKLNPVFEIAVSSARQAKDTMQSFVNNLMQKAKE
jgi:hypothetical protein